MQQLKKNTIITRGSTLSECIHKAGKYYSVKKIDLKYEVLQHRRNGFLGIGRTEFKIKAWLSSYNSNSLNGGIHTQKLNK